MLGYHAGVLPGGSLGVDVFFVLSGFLITSLLIEERERTGQVSFRHFYMRRVLRILPALGCVIASAAVLAAVLDWLGGSGDRHYAIVTLASIPAVILFAGNWIRALAPASLIGSLGALGHTWSLATEEQFYLLWPAILAILTRLRLSRARLAALLALLAGAEMIYREVLFAAANHATVDGATVFDRIYYGADTHSDGLLIGCALAFWLSSGGMTSAMHRVRSAISPSGRLSAVRSATGIAAAGLLALFVIGTEPRSPTMLSAGVLLSAVLVVGAVTESLPGVVTRLLESPAAVWLGRRSYGLYLWQYVCFAASYAAWTSFVATFHLGPTGQRFTVGLALGLAIFASFMATELSYRFVELPALRLKRKFRAEPVLAESHVARANQPA